jgi:hypothetical protein
LTRRAALGWGAAAIVLPALPAFAAPGNADAALWRALDGLAALPDPAAKLVSLARFRVDRLSRARRLDLEIVRYGLGIDRQLAGLVDETAPERFGLLLARGIGQTVPVGAARARLQAECDHLTQRALPLFDTLGIKEPTLGARYRRLFADPRYLYPDSDAGRAEAVADMSGWLDRTRTALPRWFGPLPPRCPNVGVRALTPEEIAAGKGGYRILPTDSERGWYIVDLKAIARRPRWTLHSVVHHELLPGHMVQLPIQALADPHPLRLHYAAAFIEGWGVYGEMLAWRGGLLSDPRDQLGAIHWLLFRIMRGLADIGLNHDGWSLDRARALLEDEQGEPVYFAPFADDLARMTKEPAIRAAEALIALTLAERVQATRDIRRLHAALLAGGAHYPAGRGNSYS